MLFHKWVDGKNFAYGAAEKPIEEIKRFTAATQADVAQVTSSYKKYAKEVLSEFFQDEMSGRQPEADGA